MREHFSIKLVVILVLITVMVMSIFVAIRHYHSSAQFKNDMVENSQFISSRIAIQIKPSIWEVYLSSVNRQFSEVVAIAVLDSEMNNNYVDAIVVYGRFGHLYMGRVKNSLGDIIPYLAHRDEILLDNYEYQVDHSIKNGSMTIGKVVVYFNDEPLRTKISQALELDLIQIIVISGFIVFALFYVIKIALIKPLESLEIAKSTFNSLDEGILYINNENQVINANPAFFEMTGFSIDDTLNRKCDFFDLNFSEEKFLDEIEFAIRSGKSWSGEAYCKHNQSEPFPVQLTASQVNNDEHQNVCRVLVFQNISLQKEAEKQLKKLAFYDYLTGLANRRKFDDILSAKLKSSKRKETMLGLLFIDLDDFKYINDTLGHSEGDELLIKLAQRFKRRIRESDYLSRLGGDEFTVIVTQFSSPEFLASLAQDLLELANQPITLQDKEYQVSLSVGISIYPNDGEDVKSLVKHADSAMYHAKALGKNRYALYSSEIDKNIQYKQNIKSLLNQAISKNEFYLQYQPKVCLMNTREIVCAEALIRWQNDEYGLVPPDEFIPIAEETSVIIDIGEWVIEQAFSMARKQNEKIAGKIFKLAINLSARQLHSKGLVPFIERELIRHKIKPDWIEFEITESSIITDFDLSIANLNKLKQLGFSLSLDDFGTGYSSLSYLTKLPIDILKIDKSFVFEVGESRRAELVVETILALSKSLGLTTVAEGIETKKQLEFLLAHGCEYGQGYYFSRPLIATDFEKFIDELAIKEKNVLFMPRSDGRIT